MADDRPPLSEAARHVQQAFRWIEAERAKDPASPLAGLIERACAEYALSAKEATWLHWSLDPASVAVQPKEPVK